jgi:hypothetical protein
MSHPNPHAMTEERLDKLIQNTGKKQTFTFQLWNGEEEIQLITASSIYGFWSAVLVRSNTDGVSAEHIIAYAGTKGVDVPDDSYPAMLSWICEHLNHHATGTGESNRHYSRIELTRQG